MRNIYIYILIFIYIYTVGLVSKSTYTWGDTLYKVAPQFVSSRWVDASMLTWVYDEITVVKWVTKPNTTKEHQLVVTT